MVRKWCVSTSTSQQSPLHCYRITITRHTTHHSPVHRQHIHSLFHIPVVKMADATNVDASKVEETKVEATPAAEDKKADAPPAPETTAQADQAVPVEAPAVPEPSSNATTTEEKATTADPPKEEAAGSTEAAAPAPAATEAKAADEAKPAEEQKEAPKVDGETETKPAAEEAAPSTEKEAAASTEKEAAASTEKEAAVAPKEATPKKTPFEEFDAKVADILKEIDHDEMWGVKLVTPAASHVPTQIVIQKYLNANDGDLAKAIDQFKGALKFRKEKKPLELIKKTFNASKFAELGAVTVYTAKDSVVPEVFTWNLYGNVKGKIEEAFTPLDEYVQSRTA